MPSEAVRITASAILLRATRQKAGTGKSSLSEASTKSFDIDRSPQDCDKRLATSDSELRAQRDSCLPAFNVPDSVCGSYL